MRQPGAINPRYPKSSIFRRNKPPATRGIARLTTNRLVVWVQIGKCSILDFLYVNIIMKAMAAISVPKARRNNFDPKITPVCTGVVAISKVLSYPRVLNARYAPINATMPADTPLKPLRLRKRLLFSIMFFISDSWCIGSGLISIKSTLKYKVKQFYSYSQVLIYFFLTNLKLITHSAQMAF